MEVKYKIIETHPATHQVVARFYSDALTEEALAVVPGDLRRCRTDIAFTLPVPAPTGDALHEIIMRGCPWAVFETHAAVGDPAVDTSLSALTELIGVERKAEKVAPKDRPMLARPVNPRSDTGTSTL
jgi:hypothetical protein